MSAALFAGNTVATATFQSPGTGGPENPFIGATGLFDCQNNIASDVTGSVTGQATNSSAGVTLSGSGSIAPPSGAGCFILNWSGNGAGTFNTATLPAKYDFTITTTGTVTGIQCTLSFFINSGTFTRLLFFTPCSGSVSAANQVIDVPNGSAFSRYQVQLQINANFGAGSTLTVTVPAATSIDINPPLALAAVPAPSSFSLILLGAAALALADRYRNRTAGARPV
jgi:hypothetical protein